MIIELGNHCPTAPNAVDARPKVTRIHIPEADGNGLGGYTHEPGLNVSDFIDHVKDAIINRSRIWRLPEHEILLSVTQEAWTGHAGAQNLNRLFVDGSKPGQHDHDFRPAWVSVQPHPLGLTPSGRTEDIENFLREYYQMSDSAVKPADLEDRYWTPHGEPGACNVPVPGEDQKMLFTNVGRTMQAELYAGGQVGKSAWASASTATTLTDNKQTWTVNQWAGNRVYAVSGSQYMVWGNILSNTSTSLTVDRWYRSETPGGAAGPTPVVGATPLAIYMIADGGGPSAWFVGMTTTNITPAATDTFMSGEYTTANGGYIRKIAPYTLTSGTSPMTYTLTPVFTGNASDTYPSTFFAIGVFNGMIVTGTTPFTQMMWETSLNASATVNAVSDQVSVTETVTGS